MEMLAVTMCRECRDVGYVMGEDAEELRAQGRTVSLEYCKYAQGEEGELGGHVVHDILVYVDEGDENHDAT